MKKAPIAVALVLVFGLFAAAFSLAPAVAQYTPPSDSTATSSTNSTSSSDTTTSTTTNTTEGETFSASGSIATLIFDMGETTTTSEVQDATTASNDTSMTGNATTSGNTSTMMPQVMTSDNATSSGNMTGTSNITSSNNATTSTTSNETSTVAEEVELPYIVSGEWTLDVQHGNVSNFSASFTMIHTDGTGRHTHDMSNFVSSNSSTIDTSADGTSFIFGTVDIATDGEARWTGADALIMIEKNNVVSISLATEDTEDHFGGQPIYGIVESMTDENGNELVEGATETADNITQGAENAVNETGEFLGNVTEGIQDFFNGTGQ